MFMRYMCNASVPPCVEVHTLTLDLVQFPERPWAAGPAWEALDTQEDFADLATLKEKINSHAAFEVFAFPWEEGGISLQTILSA